MRQAMLIEICGNEVVFREIQLSEEVEPWQQLHLEVVLGQLPLNVSAKCVLVIEFAKLRTVR
jgi:hypothetical protein